MIDLTDNHGSIDPRAGYRRRMTSEELPEIRSDWPGTTLDGEPEIVSGALSVYSNVDGGASLNLAVGAAGAPPEECDYVKFVLSAEQADALAQALTRGVT